MCWIATTVTAAGVLGLTLATCSLTSPPDGAGSFAPPPTPPRAEGAPPDQELAILPQSTIRLAGKATIGSWDCASRQVGGEIDLAAKPATIQAWFDQWERVARRSELDDPIEIPLQADTEPSVQLRVPVTSLKSGNEGMESDMRAALKAMQHPLIEYRLTAVQAAELVPPEDGEPAFLVRLNTTGELTLAGEQREIDMTVIARRLDDGRFSLLGRKRLKMTDFKINPPSALFGLIRAEDTVEVVFDLVVGAPGDADRTP